MVNPDSPAFKFSEKIGLVIGKMMRYALIVSGIAILASILKNSKLSNNSPSKPTLP